MIELEDIIALEKVIDLVKEFSEKNLIKKNKIKFSKLIDKVEPLKSESDTDIKERIFFRVLRKLKTIIQQDLHIPLYFLVGAHGGVIIEDSGFCEFDSPEYALSTLIKRMELAIKTNMPYNLEIATCCLEWLKHHIPSEFSRFLELFNEGKFEIINPSYAQPYNLIISAEANIKHFEYGLNTLKDLNLPCDLFYCSESSLHPQIPQILKGFGIQHASLRARLLGVNPTSNSAVINWIGLDNSSIDALIDQSGVFNGEYWHGAFFKELPSLLFQAVGRHYMEYLLYSCIEDFMNELPLKEEVWRICNYSDLLGKFLQCSEVFQMVKKEGEYKFSRDQFLIGDYAVLTSELLLQNRNAEIALTSAEFINTILGQFNENPNDLFFKELWKKLLLAQAHDSYVVPFIKTGDYSRAQLPKEEFERLNLSESGISISDLSIQIFLDIQCKCKAFVESIFKQMTKNAEGSREYALIFNPTPYPRRDVVEIEGFKQKFISEVPGYGCMHIFLDEITSQKPSFLFDVSILPDLKTIQVKFNGEIAYEIQFSLNVPYTLEENEKFSNNIEETIEIKGNMEKSSFTLNITQYNEINRLEFKLDAILSSEIVIIPKIQIEAAFINYPFGIEKTKRTKIQSLDFLWLKGPRHGLIYIQKNTQKFVINQESFQISNLIPGKGNYEFCISMMENQSPLLFVDTYYHRLIGHLFDKETEFIGSKTSFLSLEPPVATTNLWKREKNIFLRLFNPSDENIYVKLEGDLLKTQLTEINFNYKQITSLNENIIEVEPWKIKTFKF